MKSLPPDSPISSSAEVESAVAKPSGWYQKLKGVLRRFKADLRGPIPGTEGLSRGARFKERCKHLVKRYGWKLVLAIVIYYLIRDSILYIIIPYLLAKKLLG
jgi:hypothetical protein